MMSRTTRVATLISVVSLTLLAINPAPGASAASVAENGVCEVDELCMYSDDGYKGYVYDFRQCEDDNRHSSNRFPGTNTRLEDRVQSIWNRSGYVYSIYDRPQYMGNSKSIFPDQKVDSLGTIEKDNGSHQCTGS
jgi:hypothetical protein